LTSWRLLSTQLIRVKLFDRDGARRLYFSPESSSVRELAVLGRNAAIGYYDAESLQLLEHTVESRRG
jgi:hypothetical protein